MSGCSRLPTPLLDLIFTRAYTPSQSLVKIPLPWHTARRYSHATALRTRQLTPHIETQTQSFYARSRRLTEEPTTRLEESVHLRQLSELEERVVALKNTTVTEEVLLEVPSYSEDDLLSLYEDLLALPSAESVPSDNASIRPSEDDDDVTIQAIADRLLQQAVTSNDKAPLLLTDQLRKLRNVGNSTPGILEQPISDHVGSPITHASPLTNAIVSRLDTILSELENVQTYVAQKPSISVGLLTDQEWSTMIRVCVRNRETETAEKLLGLMKRANASITEDSLDIVMASYADAGDTSHMESFMQRFITESPTERQRDLHIKAYIKASPSKAIPLDALSILHNYESQAIPAPQQTYTRIIAHLFHARSSVAHAHAWDLFSHMRYAAHPSPDALLYGLMIRACASPSFCNGVEPERALDLFTEMTVQQGIPPNAGTYIAIILACARSGRQAYVHEAFRLAKQMLDAHRDARGASEFRPSKRLFCALLEGAKRIGDLARARWILAEMIRTSREEQEEHGGATEPSVKVDQEVMLHVFQTYAAYKLPFKRSETVIVEQTSDAPVSPSPTNSNRSEATDVEPVPETNSTFLHIPPQNRAALLAEVDTLFSQIVELRNQAHDDVSHNFRFVEVTPQLLNAYLSVHYARSSPRVCHDLYRKLFSGLGVQKIPRIHIEALERCTNARKGPDRIDALKFAEEIWEEWRPLETKWRNRESDPLAEIVTPRQVERATAAMVRVYSVIGQLDRALECVKSFVQKYPPTAIRQASPKHDIRSTRTVLDAARPLVRLTTTMDIPDDSVPPLLTFPEVEVLHHRLVAKNRVDDIRYLKWVCKSYEGSLKMRRDRTIKAVPESLGSDERDEDEDCETQVP